MIVPVAGGVPVSAAVEDSQDEDNDLDAKSQSGSKADSDSHMEDAPGDDEDAPGDWEGVHGRVACAHRGVRQPPEYDRQAAR
jgi:hypothetical protein